MSRDRFKEKVASDFFKNLKSDSVGKIVSDIKNGYRLPFGFESGSPLYDLYPNRNAEILKRLAP